MISIPDRRQAVELLDEAVAAGARCAPACEAIGISIRIYLRWAPKRPVRTDGRPQAPKPMHRAVTPCQVWSWDITWLRSPIGGIFHYAYPIIDLYSRKIVGWDVHAHESTDLAAALVRRGVLAEGCVDKPLVLHAGNGGP